MEQYHFRDFYIRDCDFYDLDVFDLQRDRVWIYRLCDFDDRGQENKRNPYDGLDLACDLCDLLRDSIYDVSKRASEYFTGSFFVRCPHLC